MLGGLVLVATAVCVGVAWAYAYDVPSSDLNHADPMVAVSPHLDAATALRIAGTSWQLESCTDSDATLRHIHNPHHYTLHFHATDNRIHGQDLCNTYTGAYAIGLSTGDHFKHIAVTEMGCPTTPEVQLSMRLANVHRFLLENRADHGRRLVCVDRGNDNRRLTFQEIIT